MARHRSRAASRGALVAGVVASVALATVAAVAQARPVTRFLLDGRVGVAAPIADSDYANSFWPSPMFGLALGAEIWLVPRLALAPELTLDGGPYFGQHSSGVTTGRFRARPGLRLAFGFGHGHAVFLRWLVGAEAFIFGPGGRGGSGTMNWGFATEPGAGMQFRVAEHAVLGFTAGFPVGLHTFGTPTTSTDVDFDLAFFVGYRR